MFFNAILPSAIAIATVFLYGCLGETLMEKVGHLNLGIPGIMCMGTFGGCLGVSLYMSNFKDNPMAANWFLLVFIAIILSFIFAAIGGLIYAFITVTLKCNQNVTGLALTTFGAGFVDYFMNSIDKTYFAYASKIFKYHLPFGDNLGAFGNIFINHGILVYLALVLAIVAAFVLKRTRIGLSLRAIGENPATADAAGINVNKYKYITITLGSGIAGLGGLFYVMDYVGGSWENSGTIQAFGWLAIALVIFSIWKPGFAIIGSIIFGVLFVVPSYLTGISNVTKNILSMLPYIVTIVVLIITSIVGKQSVQPPASLGVSYFREDR